MCVYIYIYTHMHIAYTYHTTTRIHYIITYIPHNNPITYHMPHNNTPPHTVITIHIPGDESAGLQRPSPGTSRTEPRWR